MTSVELKTARISQGLTAAEMARVLETSLRTYQDWESGKSRIPGAVGVAVRLHGERLEWTMVRAVGVACAAIDRNFPGGIPSAVGE